MSGNERLTSGGNNLICWDASVLISFIKEDNEEAERVAAIEEVFQEVRRGKHKLLFSALIYPEVLESAMSQRAMRQFNEVLKNRDVTELIAAADIKIAQKAQEIRNRRKSITTPDAIHLATAIIHEADGFHTFDDALLGLSGRDEVEGLVITACSL